MQTDQHLLRESLLPLPDKKESVRYWLILGGFVTAAAVAVFVITARSGSHADASVLNSALIAVAPHFEYAEANCDETKCEASEIVQLDTWSWAPTCITGRAQSPIDIVTKEVATAGLLDDAISLSIGSATLVPSNTGHGFQFTSTGGTPSAMFRGEKFNFKQTHWHTPSENTVDGEHAAMEGHFVFQLDDPLWVNTTLNLAVMAVFFELGDCNQHLSAVWDTFPIDRLGTGTGTFSGEILASLLASVLGGGYYLFTGSLTTPPCTEGVAWNVMKKRTTVCQDQVDRLKHALSATANGVDISNRVVQPLHQRVVTQTSR
jgi:carbonic anhydrase